MHTTRRNFFVGGATLVAGQAMLLSPAAAAMKLAAGQHGPALSVASGDAPAIPTEKIEIIGQGALHCEGVVVGVDGSIYGAGNASRVIYKLDPDGKLHEVATLPDGATPSGVTMDRNGDIICCDSGTKSIFRIDPVGKVSVLAQRSPDFPIAHPNFPTYDGEGNLFVTNSTQAESAALAMQAGEFTSPQPNGALYRIRANGKKDLVATGLCWANGTAFDPKEEALYLLQSTQRNCLRIPLRKNGTFGRPEVFAENFPGIPDGMAFAEDGTMFVTIPATMGTMSILNQVLKVERDGKWSVFLNDSASAKLMFPTNCAFGGPERQDLVIANLLGNHFNRVHTTFVGHRLYHQR